MPQNSGKKSERNTSNVTNENLKTYCNLFFFTIFSHQGEAWSCDVSKHKPSIHQPTVRRFKNYSTRFHNKQINFRLLER